MKTVATLLFSAALAAQSSAPASSALQPRGTLLELHSCELYAGGCTVSSEATQGGRYLLRAWNFTAGEFAGASFAGLNLALLQDSTENLASPSASPRHSVLYLPEAATPEQRAALVAWIRATQPASMNDVVTRVLPIQWQAKGQQCQLTAGDFLSVQTASLESCPTGACGEALWYTPRTANSVFTVALNQSSRVAEPSLKLRWEDAGKKSVFLARFGQATPARSLFVSLADLCGPAGSLF